MNIADKIDSRIEKCNVLQKSYMIYQIVLRLRQKIILLEKKCLIMIDLDKIKLPYGSFSLYKL